VAKVFIDTNILVYALDNQSAAKQKRAREIINNTAQNDSPVISTQVLQEFYSAVTIKLHTEALLAKNMLHNFTNMETVQITVDMIEQGIDISILARLSFWDGLIIAAAEFAKCTTVLSEDLQHGQIIRGVKIINPFI
jgi:predicted nucleic acid-binding protein